MATLTLNATPTTTTEGGIVTLDVTFPGASPVPGVYRFEWQTEGPVATRFNDPQRAMGLERAASLTRALTTETILVLDPTRPLRTTWDTSDLRPARYTVALNATLLDPTSPEVTSLLTRSGAAVAPADMEKLRTSFINTANTADRLGSAPPVTVDVTARPLKSGDDVKVTMKRTEVAPTKDQALWALIRNATSSIDFDHYNRFMDVLLCGDTRQLRGDPRSLMGRDKLLNAIDRADKKIALPFPDVDAYRFLKVATEVFMMVNCGVNDASELFVDADLADERLRFNRGVQPGEIEAIWQDYLVDVQDGPGGAVATLPYLALVRAKLRDVSLTDGSSAQDRAAVACYGVLREKLAHPCMIELLWSYWHEEGMLVQTLNAISWRFQNRRGRGPNDPLSTLEIDPLRPLNNFLWGYVQDELFRLTLQRRAYEYDHHYGITLIGKAVPPVHGADSRSHFIEAFHRLLHLVSIFYKEDDDTTVMADAFPVLNALKEVHLLLTQGAHNQYGDLPWTARQEMLMQEWLLARPEMREFLPTRVMVAYPEPWMDRVEAMKTLQGWTSISVLHFRDLGIFGEQILLGIRFGAWTKVIESEQAANWARYWRPETQGYIHAYRAVAGIDLTEQVDARPPALHLSRRLAAESAAR